MPAGVAVSGLETDGPIVLLRRRRSGKVRAVRRPRRSAKSERGGPGARWLCPPIGFAVFADPVYPEQRAQRAYRGRSPPTFGSLPTVVASPNASAALATGAPELAQSGIAGQCGPAVIRSLGVPRPRVPPTACARSGTAEHAAPVASTATSCIVTVDAGSRRSCAISVAMTTSPPPRRRDIGQHRARVADGDDIEPFDAGQRRSSGRSRGRRPARRCTARCRRM